MKILFEKRRSRLSSAIFNGDIYYDSSHVTFDSEIEGIFIIVKGIWKVINRKDNYVCWELFKGDWFGESEVLNILDWTYFGDIFAKSDVDVMYISYKNFNRIPYYELNSMLRALKGRYNSVWYTASKRYQVEF